MFSILVSVASAGETFMQLQGDAIVTLVPVVELDGRLKVLVDAPLGEKASLGIFSSVSPGYAKILAGPTLHVQRLALNLSVGLETADLPFRAGGTALLKNENYFAFGTLEYGGSGLWYKTSFKGYWHDFMLGALFQRYDGLGPQLGFRTHGLEVWTSPMYDFEDQTISLVSGITWVP